MTVHCPHCSTGYVLPDHLLGPRGARVRCPHCQGAFVVIAEPKGSSAPAPGPSGEELRDLPADAVAPAGDAPSPSAPAPEPVGDGDPVTIATGVLDELSRRLGAPLETARAEGRVFAEFGPAMMEAYEEYRRRLGTRATASAFREALRARWAIDLGGPRES